MNTDPLNGRKRLLRWLSAPLALLALLVTIPKPATAQVPPSLFTSAPTFYSTNHILSTTLFHWFTATGGQVSGPWVPLEGRASWDGSPAFWQGQIKQMMRANIDMIYVMQFADSSNPNLSTTNFPASAFDPQLVNFFTAYSQLRAQGYDTPKIAPFLDTMITWNLTNVDLSTTAGKNAWANQYIRFYNMYYSVNTDSNADTYIARQSNKPILNAWHVNTTETLNVANLARSDVSNRLVAAFGTSHPMFMNGFVQVGCATDSPSLGFVDEKIYQFEDTAYNTPTTYKGISTMTLKAGYWDQNVRNPGSFLARSGGVNYSNSLNSLNPATVKRANIESWNEYDEGTGIYAGTNLPPYIDGSNPSNSNNDTWSVTGDPFEYIKTTARGAAGFCDIPAQSAKILWHTIPATLMPGESRTVTVIVRNAGSALWTGATNYKLGQADADATTLVAGKRVVINDTQDEIPLYGGIFRGRAKAFTFTLQTPATPGNYTNHFQMLQEGVAWFGDTLTNVITVKTKTAATVTLTNLSQMADGYNANTVSATTTPAGLTVNLSYNGSPYPPTTAGSYTVVGIINDVSYYGSVTNTLVLATNPIPNWSFEANPVGTTINAPQGGGNVVSTPITGWRFVDVNPANASLTATIITNASAGKQALRLDCSYNGTGGPVYLDQWDVGMHAPVVYGHSYLMSFDAAWISGATATNFRVNIQEFDNTGINDGGSGGSGVVSVLSTSYRTYNFLYTPQNPNTTEIGFVLIASPNGGTTSVSVDNAQMVDASGLPTPPNGSFEYCPLGAAVNSGGGGSVVDSSTFLGWRCFNAAASDYTTLNAVIVTNASAGNQAIQLTAVHATTGSGGNSGLDLDNNRLFVDDTKAYLLTFDAAWVAGATANNLGIILAQFDASGTFLGQPISTFSVSSSNYQKFTIYYKPTAGATQLNPNFQPLLNTAGSTTLRLDNVQLVDTSNFQMPWNGSFEYSPASAVVSAPQGGGNVVNDTTLVGWRFVGTDSANASFTAAIITNASAGKQALRFDKSANGPSYIDQWDAAMQTPVVYGHYYLVSLDAAWISGATPNNVGIGAQEFNSGAFLISEGIGTASVSSSNYTKYAFLWTLQNPVAADLSLSITPGAGAISLDNIQIVDVATLPVPLNGSFEYSPMGTTSSIGTNSVVDSTTVVGWRLFSVGSPAIVGFTGTIVNAGNYTGGTPGSHAMRLIINNTGSPSGNDYALDTDNHRIPITPGNHYSLSFDLELDGTTGGTELCDVGIAEFDVNGTFLGAGLNYTPTLPTDQTFHHYSVGYLPQNPNATQIVIAFRPRNPGYSATLVLDNVVFGPYIPVANTVTFYRAAGSATQVKKAKIMSYEPLGLTLVTNSATTANGATLTTDTDTLYVPTSGVDDSFTYTVTDGYGNNGTGTVMVKVGAPTGSPAVAFPNGDFTANPIGTAIGAATNGISSTTTFANWRFFSVTGPTAADWFAAVIIDASTNGTDIVQGGVPGTSAVRFDIDQRTHIGADHGFDRNSARLTVTQGVTYTLSFDARNIGGTGSLNVSMPEFNGSGAFTGSQVGFTPTLDSAFRIYTYSWTPQNAATVTIAPAFRPNCPGATLALSIGNVKLHAPVAANLATNRASGSAMQVRIADLMAGATDDQNHPVTFAGTSVTTTNGKALSNDGTYISVPTNTVADSFTYQITDGLGATNFGTVSITVSGGMSSTPTNIVFSVSGGNTLNLTWPGSHLGWVAQSNSVNVANPSYWFNIPGSETVTNLNIPISPAMPNVFYRLRLP